MRNDLRLYAYFGDSATLCAWCVMLGYLRRSSDVVWRGEYSYSRAYSSELGGSELLLLEAGRNNLLMQALLCRSTSFVLPLLKRFPHAASAPMDGRGASVTCCFPRLLTMNDIIIPPREAHISASSQ